MTTITHSTASSSKGSPNGDHGADDSNSKYASLSNDIQEDEDDRFTFRSRKSYPQRVNRPKLNYRDLERGVYDAHELRQSSWALGGPTLLNKNNRTSKNTTDYSDDDDVEDDDDDRDIPADDDNEKSFNEKKSKSNDDTDQKHRRLWCICKKPWDHSRLMLRCDSCANWYHGDCIGVTKEQARVLDMNGDQFVCPPCRGVSSTNSGIKSGRSSDESILIKRKRLDAVSPSDRKVGDRNGNIISTKNLTLSEPLKRPKTGIFFQRDSAIAPQIHCIVHGCSNWAKSGWVYCSTACIRRHINDTLQAIQRSKGPDNDSPPSREDILLYQSRTKKVLDRKLVPKVEDLCTWINQNPSYEIVKPALRQSILLTANESKSSLQLNSPRSPALISPKTPTTPTTPTTPNSIKPKLSWVPIAPNTKPIPIKKAPVQLGKQTSNTPSSPGVPNYADIRMKVPQALYDKLIMRLEKSGDKSITNDDIRTLTEKIEEEMYRVYGKVDNSYKNKFRSLLANISNMNNNFFYKHILSKEVTAKYVVAMKPEDMLPPEEKEKRKDEFQKEVQMIMKAEEQTAEEMARRARTKITRQGIVDNDSVLSMLKKEEKVDTSTEAKPVEVKKSENNSNVKSIPKTKKPVTSTTGQKSVVKSKPKPKLQVTTSTDDTTSAHDRHTFDINCSICVNSTKSTAPSPKPSISIPSETTPRSMESFPIKQIEERSPASPPIREESRRTPPSTFVPVDIDNDYIEPESPTGIDALLYDDDDDLNHINTHPRSSISHQHPDSPGDNNDYLPSAQSSIRDDYNPLVASKPKAETSSPYQPTSIDRPSSINQQWRGIILPTDAKIPCQSARIYGDAEYLIADIPEQLGVLGRLRLGDLWDYIRESLPVRDVIILTLISSNDNDNQAFLRYIETMRASGRATVINKRLEPTVIRDMYVLPADTKDCSTTVLETLSLPKNIDSKQLFLIIIGAGKKTMKSFNRPNETQSMTNLTYKPVALQDPAAVRDPRLLRNKDPRIAATNDSETTTGNASPPTSSKPSTDDLKKLIAESLGRIRQATSTDAIHPIVLSTMELLNSFGRDDLCKRFTTELQTVISEWQVAKDATATANTTTTTTTTDDNLIEENMEVDDEQDDKNKKQLSISEFNDIDYRFFDQDMDHRVTTTMSSGIEQQDSTQKSHFPDLFSAQRDADDRSLKSNLTAEDRTKINY